MLTIGIPVYNYDVNSIVDTLSYQAQQLKIVCEILVIDDCSAISFKEINKTIRNYSLVRYIELSENVGRAKIRNIIADKAIFNHILFLDCDIDITDEKFLLKYISQLNPTDVICGGTAYQTEPPSDKYLLRWIYGIKRECIDVSERSKKPYHAFATINFIAPKKIFNTIRFNEQLTQYGHEDTLFGFELYKNNIPVKHINNPVIHKGLEQNTHFILKTEKALGNLLFIYENLISDKKFVKFVRVLSCFKIIKFLQMCFIINLLLKLLKPYILKNLTSNTPSMFLFDFYKICILCKTKNN